MTETTFYDDLLQAQKEIEAVDKDGKNPFFKSDYTTLNATILACKEILNKHNIIILQPILSDEFGVHVCTVLVHKSGERIESKMKIEPAKVNDPQAQGSAITYARRYSLKSLLTLSDNDDDGEASMNRSNTNTTTSRSSTPKPSPKPVSGLTRLCPIHNTEMTEHISKKGTPYFGHIVDNKWCFGRTE